MRALPRFAFVISLIAFFPSSSRAAIPTSERDALIALYNSTDGDNWTDNTGWLGEPGTECTWFGVSCDPNETRVADLILPGNNLVGTIPSEIGDLNVCRLWLHENQLSGSIPAEIGGNELLCWLKLNDNELTGAIPPELTSRTFIQHTLDLADNQLTGKIPKELAIRPGGNCCLGFFISSGIN